MNSPITMREVEFLMNNPAGSTIPFYQTFKEANTRVSHNFCQKIEEKEKDCPIPFWRPTLS